VSETVATCPCCNSTVRVIGEARLEAITMTKPGAGERWMPPISRRVAPVTLPVPSITATRDRIDRDAIGVIERVAEEEGFSLAELRSPQRLPELVIARRRAAVAARSETHASLPQIGRILNRDHSTVLHHLRRAGAAA
jgi:hypothetical protein